MFFSYHDAHALHALGLKSIVEKPVQGAKAKGVSGGLARSIGVLPARTVRAARAGALQSSASELCWRCRAGASGWVACKGGDCGRAAKCAIDY